MTEHAWQEELWSSYRSAQALVGAGLLKSEELPALEPVFEKFGFLLPRYYANLIDPHDPHCPIRLQAIPSSAEIKAGQGMVADPLQDLNFKPAERITHRYSNRVLLHLTPNCSMYCRFCFRKTLLNELKSDLFAGSWREAVEYVRTHTEVEEVILSGGDPLLLTDSQLGEVLRALDQIPTLQRIRFHTRVPVTFPMRVTGAFCGMLGELSKGTVVVTHFNHPKEVTEEAARACALLREATDCLLNQSVLLKRVNDSASVLGKLSRSLFDVGVLPYYLHHPDRAQGTQHFDISIEEGTRIFNQLRVELPGYLVPRYVIDQPAVLYKMSVTELL